MAEPVPMTPEQISEGLKTLNGWTYENGALVRMVVFSSFIWGIEFVNAIAHMAERQQHHPDIDIRYTQVTLRYWTHSVRAVTALDFAGAREAEQIIAQFKKEPVSSASST